MAKPSNLITVTEATSGDTILVNTDLVRSIHPRGDGSTIVFAVDHQLETLETPQTLRALTHE